MPSEVRSTSPISALHGRGPQQLLGPCEATGIPYVADHNGPELDGASIFQVTQRNGRRWSAADAYLRPARDRPNLEVVTGPLVLGLVVDGDRVTGARYRIGRGAERVAHAEREVLLSAGSIGSPQVLLLSGSGPPTS